MMVSGPVVTGDNGGAAGRDALALGGLLADLLGAPLEVVTHPGATPAAALTDAALQKGAALLVLGPTHRHSLARTLRGTARRVLRDAPCPVAVAPAGFAERPRRRIGLIGVGAEPTGEGGLAIRFAHDLAARADAGLFAVGVVLPLSPLAYDDPRDPVPSLAEKQHVVQVGLEHVLAALPAGVPCRAQAVVGDPGMELAAASAEVDLLVSGSRRRGPLRAAVLGSVSERLLRSAACPVLFVPPAGVPRARRKATRSTVLPPPRG